MEKKGKKEKVTSFHRNGDIYNNICTALGFSSSAAFRSDPLAHWENWGQKDQMKEK